MATDFTRSADGTKIRWHRLGDGPRRWLLPPGLGTPPSAWTLLRERLGPEYSILTWEMRGCYDSDRPADRRCYGVVHHADDAIAALRGAGWDDDQPIILGGWSLGVQISLEIYRRIRQRVAGMVLLGGPFEHTLQGALPIPYGDQAVVPLLKVLHRPGALLTPVVRLALAHPKAPHALHRLGVVTHRHPHLAKVLEDFSRLHLGTLIELSRAAHHHSARDVLGHVTVPTLIVHGDRDQLTPLRIGRELFARMPGARLYVVQGGTHYALLEFPDQVNGVIADFLAERFASAND
ncbi:MAG: alpha/beta hydrolase [Deltaproteobacteria bacterium]|nr:alpha/beta hydrolase [Deltaproteobacteria bacterium]